MFKNPVKCYFTVPASIGFRKCDKCNMITNLRDFYYYKNNTKLRNHCKYCAAQYSRVSRKNNLVAYMTYQATYRSKSENILKRSAYYDEHRNELIEYQLNHAKDNPGMYNARAMQRHADKLLRTPKWLTKEQLAEIKVFYVKAAHLTRKYGYKYEVDHIVPLRGKKISGLHVPWNLRIVTKSENCRKSNKFILK